MRHRDLIVDQAGSLGAGLHRVDERVVAQIDLLPEGSLPKVLFLRHCHERRVLHLCDATIIGAFHIASQEETMYSI